MKKFFSLMLVAFIASLFSVTAQSGVVTFDEFTLPAEGHYSLTDSMFVDNSNNYWTSGGFTFSTYVMSSYQYFAGTMVSNATETTFDANNYFEHQFRSIAGPLHDNDNFAIYYGGTEMPILVNNPEGEVVKGMYITNNAWTYSSIVNGDAYSAAFAHGDYFILRIYGDRRVVDGNDTTYQVADSIDYYLADYRGESLNILSTWQWIDLSTLGTVNRIRFAFDSNVRNDWGLATPTYFCFDDFNSPRPVETNVNYTDVNITLYPIPATDKLFVSGLDGIYNVKMYTLDGVLVYDGTINNNGSIDVSAMNKGVYMLSFSGEKGTKIEKVIVK